MPPFSLRALPRAIGLLGLVLYGLTCNRVNAADLVGTLPGSVSVDNKGAANYTIPLKISPGRSGMEPKLALSYSSQAGPGVAGLGWTISTGFPTSITRGRNILARDGSVKGIRFDDTNADVSKRDKFYLDGKRLLCVSGNQGRSNSQYRTEVDSFVTVVATGTGDDIESFTLTDKSGNVFVFGKYSTESDGLQFAGGETTNAAYAYALKRVTDPVGNYVHLTYTNHGTGEHLLSKIQYTGGSSVSPAAEVNISFEADPDTFSHFVFGREIRHSKRAATITSKIGATIAASYSLIYDDVGRSFLKQVAASFADPNTEGHALLTVPATTLSHGTAGGAFALPSGFSYAPSGIVHATSGALSGDFNGDGRTDFLFYRSVTGSTNTPMSLAYAWRGDDGSWQTQAFTLAMPAVGAKPVVTGDFNGDGKTDVVFVYENAGSAGGGWYIALSNGTTFDPLVLVSTNFETSTGKTKCVTASALTLDLNGDGIDELVFQEKESHISIGSWFGDVNDYADRFWASAQDVRSSFSCLIIPGGAMHLITPTVSGGIVTYTETVPAGLFPSNINIPLNTTAPYALRRCDLDGDGRSDLIATVAAFDDLATTYHGASMMWRSISLMNQSNNTFAFKSQIVEALGILGDEATPTNAGHLFLVGDVNGDGLDDCVFCNKDCEQDNGWNVALSKGDGTFVRSAFAGAPLSFSVGAQVESTVTQRLGQVTVHTNNEDDSDFLTHVLNVEGYTLCGALLLDFDGDGRKDLVWYGSAGSGWRGFRSTGVSFDTASAKAIFGTQTDPINYFYGQNGGPLTEFGYEASAVDPLGSGAESLLLTVHTPSGQSSAAIVGFNAPHDLFRAVGVTDGLGAQTTVAYGAITSDAIYTSGATVTYPIRESRHATVVTDVFRDNGGDFASGQRQQFSYQYSGNRVDLAGRGNLGFHSFVTLDHGTKLFKYQFLTQSFPMTGLAAREETYRYWEGTVNGVPKANFRILSSHDNTVVFDKVVKSKTDTTAWGTVWPYISRAIEYRWEDSSSAHFTLSISPQTSQPEILFPEPKQSGEHIKITAESLFDEETAVHGSLSNSPFTPSDTTTAGANAVAGVLTFSPNSGLGLPGKITYGNLVTLTTDYGSGYGEKVVTGYHDPVGGLTSLVKEVQTFAWGGGYGASTAPEESPKKTFGYWVNDTVQTPLVKTETIDATGSDLDVTTTHSRDALGRVYETKIENSATGLRAIGSYSISSVPHKSGSPTEYDFDSKFDLPKTTQNAFLHDTKFDYDPILALPTSVTDANNAKITTQYDALGRATNVTNVLTSIETTTTYAFDGVTVTPPTLDAETYGHPLTLTSVYKITVATTAQPSVTTWLDRLGRPVRTTKSAYAGQTATTDTIYNSLGQVVAVSNPYVAGTTAANKLWTKTTYDALGRVRTVTSPNGTVATTTYYGRTTTVSVDADQIDDYDPAAQTTTTLVDAKGRTVKVWNANNDPGAISNTTGGASTASVEFKLDGFGRMRETILNGDTAHKITATYDALGRQETLSDPDKGAWSYINNALGQVVSQTDANSTVTESAFDHLGRPLTRTTMQSGTGGPVETASWFYYDTAADGGTQRVAQGDKGWIGALAREEHTLANAPGYTDPDSAKYFYYDTKGRPEIVLSTIDGKWFYTHTAYDTHSRPSTVRYYWRPAAHEAPGDYPYLWDNFGFTYSYDDQSHITQIADTAARVWWAANADDGYDHLDRPVKIQKGSAHWTVRAYRASDGVLTSIATGPVAGDTDIQNLSFKFDGLGNLRERTSGALTETLGYDSLNRLTSSTTQGDTTYEPNGNIATKKSVKGDASGTYAYSTTKPHAVTSAFGYTMGYDDNGNLTSRANTAANESWSLKWTGFDKPRWMARKIGSVTTGSEFLYDAHRSRVAHLEFDSMSSGAGAAPTHYVRKKLYVAGPAMEVDFVNTAASGAPVWKQKLVRLYVSAPDGTVGAVEIPSLAQGGIPDAWVYHHDHLGSIESITRYGDTTVRLAVAKDERLGRYSEDAWGQRRDPASWTGAPSATYDTNSLTPRGFTGHEMMDGVGLVNMNGRIYDPLLGRFLSADLMVQHPDRLQSYNRYTYVLNNPLTLTDPSGFADDSPTATILDYLRYIFAPNQAALPNGQGNPDGARAGEQVMAQQQARAGFDKGMQAIEAAAKTTELGLDLVPGARVGLETGTLITGSDRIGRTSSRSDAATNLAIAATLGAIVEVGAKPVAEATSKVVQAVATALSKETRALSTVEAGAVKTGLKDAIEKGKAGEAASKAEALAAGETIKGEQVTFELPSGSRTRSDLLTETPTSNLKIREAKNGPTARLSEGQTEMKETVANGGEVIPRGKNAEKAGLKPGEPIRIKEFQEDRY